MQMLTGGTHQADPIRLPGIVHSKGMPGPGFTGPGELVDNDFVPEEVIRLLNEAIWSAAFTRLR